MRKPSRLVVGATSLIVGASVATGGVALAASSPSPSSTTSASQSAKGPAGRMDGALSRLVASGTITADQKTKIEAALKADFKAGHGKGSGPMRGGEHRLLAGAMKDVAAAIGITPTQLRTELRSGKSIAQVAQAHNVSRETLKKKLLADVGNQLDKIIDLKLPA